MCAQGVNWYSAQPYTTTAKNNSETFVFGCQNDTIAGEKTEIVSPLWLVGVLGLKAEVVVGAQIGWVEGYKYDRVPLGQVEVIGDHWGGHGSHTTSVGTSFFVNAGVYAQILAPTLILTASDPVLAADAVPDTPPVLSPQGNVIVSGVPGKPAVKATTNATTLSLLATQALLTGGGNTTTNPHPANLALTQEGATLTGITQANLVSILAAALLINHTTSASLGISSGNSITANADGVTIIGNPAVTVTGAKFLVTAPQTYLGEPAVTVQTYADLLAAAQLAATNAATAAVAAQEKAAVAGAAPAPGTATGH